MGRILVTGGAGFIGSAFARQAKANGFDVTVFDNLANSHESKFESLRKLGIHCVLGDILDSIALSHAMKDCIYVVHFAAQVSVHGSIKNPKQTMRVNVEGTRAVVHEAKKGLIRKFVLASSAAVYGDNPSSPLKENDVGRNLSPYAESKLMNEDQISDLNSQGCQTFALRFFNVYGNGQSVKSGYSAVIPSFIDQMTQRQNPIVFGDGKQTRDFVHVHDVCNAILCCLEQELGPDMHFILNVATQQSTTLIDLIDEISQILSNRYDRKSFSPIFEESRKGDVKHSRGSTERISALLGWKPNISLREGLTRMIQQVRD